MTSEKNQYFSSQQPPASYNRARYIAVSLLNRYERSDAYIDKLLTRALETNDLIPQDKSLLSEIVNGVTRWKGKLDWILTGFYHGDYQKCLNIVKNAMRVGLYQALFLDKIPPPSAINDSVEIVKKIQGEKTANIVNGVLRNILRNERNIRYPVKAEDVVYHFSIIYSHPKWMVRRWINSFGEKDAERLLIANNRRPYIPLRINQLKTTPEKIYALLDEKKVDYRISPHLETTFHLSAPKTNIASASLFMDGYLTVQDSSATMAAYLANPKPGQTILDACAAPGGKSFVFAELLDDNGKIIAVDKYASKLNLIEEGAKRLGVGSIKTVKGDATDLTLEESPDIIFIDAPCSGFGTLSKKPDIKWKRNIEDLEKIVALQKRILNGSAKLAKPGSVVVYSTCTIEEEENIGVVESFLKENPEFEIEPAENYLPAEVCKDGFMQTFPHIHNIDGAFAARLIRKK